MSVYFYKVKKLEVNILVCLKALSHKIHERKRLRCIVAIGNRLHLQITFAHHRKIMFNFIIWNYEKKMKNNNQNEISHVNVDDLKLMHIITDT